MSADEDARVHRALAMVESCVQDMAEAGLTPVNMTSALAYHMHRQIAQALPDPALRARWLASLMDMPHG